MTAREFTSHAEVDAARLGVLGALSRGMGLSYAARADGISVAQAQEIADAAGWPDLDAVRAAWEDLKAALRHQHLPAGAIPLERITPAQAEQEYRGAVVQTGPTPEHLEPLADYVTRVTETYDCVTGDCGCQPEAMRSCPGRQDQEDAIGALEFYASGMKGAIDDEHARRAALPPATDSPAPVRPKPRQLPCEVCGIGVLTSYVETTGRQRHGHHPEGS